VYETLENRQLFAAILWLETFDGLPLLPRVEEEDDATVHYELDAPVWTKAPPTGWIKDDTGVPGYNNPDLPNHGTEPNEPDMNGKTEWIGWTFADKTWWSTAVDTQRREEFSRGSGAVMVADPDEWDDEDHPGSYTDDPAPWSGPEDLYNANITTSPIPLTGAVAGSYAIEFDSSWRPEGFDDGANINNQTARIEAIYNNGTTIEVLHWDSQAGGPFFHDHLPNEHVVLPLNIPAGATSVQLRFYMEDSANDWWWAVDNVALTGTRDVQDVQLIGVSSSGETASADDESLWRINYTAGAAPAVSAAKFLKLPSVPDNDAIAFNPVTGLLHHVSGGVSTSNSPSDPTFRDNHFMQTIDVLAGTNAQVGVYNANAQQFGVAAPRPSFVLPAARRTDAQTAQSFTDMKGAGEYSAARDLTWSPAHNAFFFTDYDGIYKVTAGGQSTFSGDPFISPGGIAFANVDGQLRMLVGDTRSSLLYSMDPRTGQPIGDAVNLVDAAGVSPAGILSLVEHPSGTGLLGLVKDASAPNDPLKRFLAEIDPVTGLIRSLGAVNAPISDLAFVYRAGAKPAVSEVYVSGSAWPTAFRDFVQSSNFGTSAYGYKLAATPTNADTVSWTNVNQIVLRYSAPIGAAGVPSTGTVLVDGGRTDYTVTGVETLDDRTVRLTIDRPLGNVIGGGIVGDRVTLTVPGAGQNGGNFVQQINVLQGDANREANGRVTSNDAGYVKSRLNRSTTSPTSPTQSSYTIFADIDGNGRVNSNDQGAVKSRLNDNMPALAAGAGTFSAKRIAEEVLA
jgi:hypothetical protein